MTQTKTALACGIVAASRQRDSLVSYFADISETPTLSRPEELELATELRAAERDFRGAILALSCTARAVVRMWRQRRANGLLTSRLCARAGESERGRQLDEVLGRVESLLERRGRLEPEAEELGRIDASISQLLVEADLAMSVLGEIRTQLGADCGGATEEA